MSRRRTAGNCADLRVVMVRCQRCRRVLGRLAEGWFQPTRSQDAVTAPLPIVFKFPGRPEMVLPHGRTMKAVTVVPLDRWTLTGVRCGCRRRDGKQTTFTLNLFRMLLASRLDGRTHDLIAGMPDYGLIGIHDDLEFAVAMELTPCLVDPREIMAREPSAMADAISRRIQNRMRRKTWPRVDVS